MSVLAPLARFGSGRVVIDFRRDPAAVRVALEMPDVASTVLRGRAAADAHRLVPLLYGICANAHGQASAAALAGAESREIMQPLDAARSALTAMEALREGILKIATSWADLAGEASDVTCARAALPLVSRMRNALFRESDPFNVGASPNVNAPLAAALMSETKQLLEAFVFSEPAHEWLERSLLAEVKTWSNRGATVAARLIDRIMRQEEEAVWGIERIPLGASDVGTLARGLKNGRNTRTRSPPSIPLSPIRLSDCYSPSGWHAGQPAMLDTLHALAHLPQTISELVEAAQANPSRTSTQIECSDTFGVGTSWSPRGLLLHAATVHKGRIERYDVIQPTRLNFAPMGAVERTLRNLAETDGNDSDALAFKARLVIASFDPCVAHELRVN